MHIYIRCADDIWPIFDSTAQHMACTYMDLYEWFITHWLSKMVSKLNNWQANREICARVMRNEYARRMELNISIHSIYLLFKWLLNNNIPVAVECMKRHWWEKTRRSARFFELCVFCVHSNYYPLAIKKNAWNYISIPCNSSVYFFEENSKVPTTAWHHLSAFIPFRESHHHNSPFVLFIQLGFRCLSIFGIR